MSSQFDSTSFLFGANGTFIEELYQLYLENPESVDQSWKDYFSGLPATKSAVPSASWAPHTPAIVGYIDPETLAKIKAEKAAAKSTKPDASSDSVRAHMLIRAYRVRGHLLADLDPLGIEIRKSEAELHLDPASYGFSEGDMDHPIHIGNEVEGVETATLRELIAILRAIYCRHIGLEFMHIQSLEQKEWLQHKLEALRGNQTFSAEQKKEILQNIIEVELFEQFLHVKFPGAKRFSVEGGENSITAVNAVIATASTLGVKEVILGMPHRGRLNMLTKVMGKPYYSMLSEFQGNLAHPEDLNISGDVKYHLGTSSDREFTPGHKVHLSLTANPSHLEAVNPVVVGKVRAKQGQIKDTARQEVMGLLLHGDAAFAGQGVVAETLSLSDLVGYRTGGTVHIIVNNQIGFTTSPKNARASRYPTEVAKMVEAPIFHVNGDDPEAVVSASRIAAEFRQKFKKDVVIDVMCFRLHGHNETDEPMFTQPLMYKQIGKHKTAIEVYSDNLIAQGVLTAGSLDEMKVKFRTFLDNQLEEAQSYKPNKADWLEGKWTGFEKAEYNGAAQEITGVKKEELKKIGLVLSQKPENFNTNSKVVRQLAAKQKMFETGQGIDWATAEALAFGSLLANGVPVRLSGQDCGRGTFSHRHAVLVDQETDARYLPLNHISEKQAHFEVIDSNLSEFAVLGFEYGYSLAEPNSLVLWEAQFGDFSNGAQVIIDQFISSAEIKWLRMSGLVMLLPHGYEGQGPEHSSCRIERYLQLCAEENMQVVNCTTPASYFHVLRRQIVRKYRKPLIVAAPKSLLRSKFSALEEMAEGTSFKRVIPEVSPLVADDKVRRVVISSGKVYYDLFEERTKRDIKDVALIRMEQLYPFPEEELLAEFKRYKNAEIVWCQEEPKNMGGWYFVSERIEEVLAKTGGTARRPAYAGRLAAASPATGYMKIHTKEQAALVDAALK